MKPKIPKPIPFLKEQQELSDMFEPDKVSHYFRNETPDSKSARSIPPASEEHEEVAELQLVTL